ncbi:hypothetical protein [Mesorhizobium sp.]|uniref:hypothetical protein n=1 Tax=Mesorhizobium sp. TaxID=1871066 RepID=UPI000FE983EA|nr:hypothetical protein [Mesorhizobium sp.]RWO84766.1 MAG: hypothetical protein EOQ95_24470 [Mesorhizobium sp.]RWQ58641.1 MAG: hypothetical protein EOS84_03765 [Mesorhizobium sp.]TIM10659.1 MAG: hypothetical protein E5Y62_06380 [Mesorhizobium sp.]
MGADPGQQQYAGSLGCEIPGSELVKAGQVPGEALQPAQALQQAKAQQATGQEETDLNQRRIVVAAQFRSIGNCPRDILVEAEIDHRKDGEGWPQDRKKRRRKRDQATICECIAQCVGASCVGNAEFVSKPEAEDAQRYRQADHDDARSPRLGGIAHECKKAAKQSQPDGADRGEGRTVPRHAGRRLLVQQDRNDPAQEREKKKGCKDISLNG